MISSTVLISFTERECGKIVSWGGGDQGLVSAYYDILMILRNAVQATRPLKGAGELLETYVSLPILMRPNLAAFTAPDPLDGPEAGAAARYR